MEGIVEERGVAKGDKDYPVKVWRNPGGNYADNGYILIFVLWAVIVLGFVAASFSGSTRNAIKVEKATVERTKNLFATRGAIIYAMGKVAGVSGDEDEDEYEDDEEDDEDEDDDEEETDDTLDEGAKKEKPWQPSLTPYTVYYGDRECKVFIEDESGKINVNAIDDDTRKLLVEYLLGKEFDRVEADTITDAVLDWRDPGDMKHLNGAETAYYKSLAEPYEAKNADFDSIEELALIKGMTPANYDKIRKEITIYGDGLAININFASKGVLVAIPRITPEGADFIIAHRKQKGPFKSMEDVRNSFWHLGVVGSSFEEIRPYITVDNSAFLTVRATCNTNGVSSTYRAIASKMNDKVELFAVYPD